MRPELVVEVGLDVARDTAGRWRRRHPARLHRIRTDVAVQEVPQFSEGYALS